MIKNRIARAAALVAFGLAALAGTALAGPASADAGTSGATSAAATSSSSASGTGSPQPPTSIKDVFSDVEQLNRNLAATSQQRAESLTETNARLNSKSSVTSSIPVVTVANGTPPSGQEALYGERRLPAPVSEDDAKAQQSRLQVEKDSAQQQSDLATAIQDELRTLLNKIER
ncbi:hypothetical protein [Mycolicibacterium hodleri]|uniref:hypothetical protein n=1 Tax=Mycolicibacterium hodleri TaxID=49897 RepID=UPI001129AE22|nr:hypothetical protein [Mycolicibacterium hodleri]